MGRCASNFEKNISFIRESRFSRRPDYVKNAFASCKIQTNQKYLNSNQDFFYCFRLG
ncbi:MAG: hypothetical protein ACTSWN_12040 [Promethearchaeota archaeon]